MKSSFTFSRVSHIQWDELAIYTWTHVRPPRDLVREIWQAYIHYLQQIKLKNKIKLGTYLIKLPMLALNVSFLKYQGPIFYYPIDNSYLLSSKQKILATTTCTWQYKSLMNESHKSVQIEIPFSALVFCVIAQAEREWMKGSLYVKVQLPLNPQRTGRFEYTQMEYTISSTLVTPVLSSKPKNCICSLFFFSFPEKIFIFPRIFFLFSFTFDAMNYTP